MSIEFESATKTAAAAGADQMPAAATAASNSSSSAASSSSEPEDNSFNYDTVFPSLPAPTSGPTAINSCLNFSSAVDSAASRLSVARRQQTTAVVHVTLAERKDVSFGGGNETKKKCEDIATRRGVKVEICVSKDQSLHIVITGPEERVNEAKRQIASEMQTEHEVKIKIPKVFGISQILFYLGFFSSFF